MFPPHQSCLSLVSRILLLCFFFSSRRRHTRLTCDWSSDVCSSDLDVRARPRLCGRAPRLGPALPGVRRPPRRGQCFSTDVRSDGAWMTMSAPPTCSMLPRIANRGWHDDALLTCTTDLLNTMAWWTSGRTRRVVVKVCGAAHALPLRFSCTAETTSRTLLPRVLTRPSQSSR